MYRYMLNDADWWSERILAASTRMGRTPFGAWYGTVHEARAGRRRVDHPPRQDGRSPTTATWAVAFVPRRLRRFEEFRMVLAKATDEHSAGRQVLQTSSRSRAIAS